MNYGTIGGGVVFLALAAWAYSSIQDTNERKRAHQEAIAVTELPPGTEDIWRDVVDRRLHERIKPAPGGLEINPSFLFGIVSEGVQPVFVARTMPYKVTCDAILGIQVNFGTGEKTDDVEIVSLLDAGLDTDAPRLPVDPESPAAIGLIKSLCPRVVAYMAAATTQPCE